MPGAEVAEEDNVNNIYMKRTRKKKARKFVKRRKKTRGRSLFGGKHLNKYFYVREDSVMRRRRRHFTMNGGSRIMIGGGHYNLGDGYSGGDELGGSFMSGFIAGRTSCVPDQHYTGYTHPI